MPKKIAKSVTLYSCLRNYGKKINLNNTEDVEHVLKSLPNHSFSFSKEKLELLAKRACSEVGDVYKVTIEHLGTWEREIKFDTQNS